ncbi:TPA: DnaD domain-containing protein [Staphylococcus aureus]|nr:DnaD domain-containing protein [Staphylococcus aureus]
MTGWISIDRSIQNHWLFKEKRTFSKFEAWIYLLMEANHSKAKVPIGNQIVTVERGQRLTSILTLSDLFNWSRFKVKTFLDLLESDGMLEVKTTSKYTLITIVNYDFYQSEQGRNQHQNDINPTSKQHQSNINPTSKQHQSNINPTSKQHQSNINPTSKQHQTNTNNNDNKDNNEKNVNNEKKKTTAFDFFQDNGFGFITSYNLDDLNYYLDSFENDSDEIVTASLKIAKDRNKVTWGYAKSILNTWLNANLKSIEQVRAFEKQQLESKKQNYKPFVKQSKEKTPKWLTDSTRETKTPEVDENLEKDREAFIKRLNSKWE